MNIDKNMISAGILGGIIFFMRRDLVLALIIAIVAYLMPRIGL
jgi:hypothetical protein